MKKFVIAMAFVFASIQCYSQNIKYNGNSLEIDGKFIHSKVFFRKDACQWVEIDEEMLAKIA